LRFKKIVEEEGNVPAKIAAVSGELSKVAQKFQSLTKETAATWDDDFADAIKTILDAIAENLVEGLGAIGGNMKPSTNHSIGRRDGILSRRFGWMEVWGCAVC